MTYKWRKEEKGTYLPKAKPELITVPSYQFFTLKGQGNPNGEEFTERIQTLYALSYAVRMMPKQGYMPEEYIEYVVYPLEGVWDLTEEGRKAEELDKDELVYTIMIRQPGFVNDDVVARAFESVRKKKNLPLLDEVQFETIEEGQCVQMLHIGPFDTEAETFAQMDAFVAEQGLSRKSLLHREIYLSDMRRVSPDKLKTVLRYQVH